MTSSRMSVKGLALLCLAVVALGVVPPASATSVGSFTLTMTMVWPDFPCDDPGGCSASSLNGRLVGGIIGTEPNGATACTAAAGGCALSLAPFGFNYDEPPCVVGQPLQGSADSAVAISGGPSLGARSMPAELAIQYIRLGNHLHITFPGLHGLAQGVIRFISGRDCINNNGPATVQIVASGYYHDL